MPCFQWIQCYSHCGHHSTLPTIPVVSHWKALAQMLLADSSLAEVHLWHADRHCPLVPRKWKLCCFCTDEVEDLPHAMFGAVGHQSLLTSGLLFLNPYSFSLHLYILLLSQLHQSLSSSLHCPTGIYVMFLLNWPMGNSGLGFIPVWSSPLHRS